MLSKYRFVFFLLFFVFPSLAFAATSETDAPILPVCEKSYSIEWPSWVKVSSSQEYQISHSGSLDFTGEVTYAVKRDGKVVETTKDKEKYLRYFKTPWRILLEARMGNIPCTGILTKEIQVYGNVIVYAGNDLSGLKTGIEGVLEKNNVLLKSFTGKLPFSQTENSQEIWDSVGQSDIFVIGSSDILGVFSDIVKLQRIKPVSFEKKRIYVISDFSKPLLSKILASSLSQIGATKVFLISEDQFYGIIARISTNAKNESTTGQELSYEKWKTVYSLNGFIEFLAYAGFSYQLLAFLLSITFVVLVLNILKQVIGFNVFGIYYPLLFAITLVTLGFSWALAFVAIGFISIIAVNLFTKKIHLLLHAKRSLLVSLYIMFLLFILWIDNFFELSLIDYAIFDNPLVIFPIFVTAIIADKVFQEDIDMFGKTWMLDLVQYVMITMVAYLLLEYKTLQYFLISYPDIITLVVLLNILVGRYTGLQAFEYFRFAPLLRKLNEEE